MLVSLEHVSKRFSQNNGDAIEVLQDVSFSIEEGEFVCVVGPSGCGKSTILYLIAGLEKTTPAGCWWTGRP